MKRVLIFFMSTSICVFFLISCGDDKEQKINELEHQIQIEQQMKEKAQQDAAKAQQDAAKANSTLNSLIGISIAFAIVVLIIGVAMGSRARKDANKQSIMNEGKSDD